MFTATMDGKTIATVEISLNDYSILQCRDFANDICKYTEQIADIINANQKMIAERTESQRVSASQNNDESNTAQAIIINPRIAVRLQNLIAIFLLLKISVATDGYGVINILLDNSIQHEVQKQVIAPQAFFQVVLLLLSYLYHLR